MALTNTFPLFLSFRLDSSKMIVSLLDCGLWWPILLLSRCVICLIVSTARRSIAIATCKLVISAIHWLILHIEGKTYDCFPSPTLLLKKIGHGVVFWYFKIMRISVRNFFCSKVLCPRGGLTLKTQQVLNHELMSAMKEYLTQGRKNFWRTIEKTIR